MEIRVGCGDPGKSDPYGFMGIQGYLENDAIQIRLAKQWIKPKHFKITPEWVRNHYAKVAKDITQYKERLGLYIGIELNNDGKQAISYFKTKVFPIVTSANLNDTPKDHFVMDKPEIVLYVKKLKEKKLISFSDNTTPDMMEFINQFTTFVEYPTRGSTRSYAAAKGHDDLVMAFLLCVFLLLEIKKFYKRNGRLP